MALFESYERRIEKIKSVLSQYGISSVEECREICKAAGFDPYEIVKGIQPICFENACWAYCVGAAIALKKNVQTAAEAAEAIGIGLQSFCIPGSVGPVHIVHQKGRIGDSNGNALLSNPLLCSLKKFSQRSNFRPLESGRILPRSIRHIRNGAVKQPVFSHLSCQIISVLVFRMCGQNAIIQVFHCDGKIGLIV